MTCRRHGSKPTLALWMLVAVADLALIVVTAGLLMTVLVAAGLVTVAAAVAGVRLLAQRGASTAESVPPSLTARRSA
jgi:UPF0716 family protein affecting phage T7 exclusion